MFFLIRFTSRFTLGFFLFVRFKVKAQPSSPFRVNTNPRQLLLLEEVRTRRTATVEQLAETLGVTLQTVRRDIQRLAKRFELDYAAAEQRFTKYDAKERVRLLRHKKDTVFATSSAVRRAASSG